jgi:hypothetical protein
MSGWMPEYWEYCKVVYGHWWDAEWLSFIDLFIDRYDEEMVNDDAFADIHGGAPS